MLSGSKRSNAGNENVKHMRCVALYIHIFSNHDPDFKEDFVEPDDGQAKAGEEDEE